MVFNSMVTLKSSFIWSLSSIENTLFWSTSNTAFQSLYSLLWLFPSISFPVSFFFFFFSFISLLELNFSVWRLARKFCLAPFPGDFIQFHNYIWHLHIENSQTIYREQIFSPELHIVIFAAYLASLLAWSIGISSITFPYCVLCYAQLLSCVQLLANPWTVAHEASLSMAFFRQGYWSGLPFPMPGDLPNPGIKPTSHASPALAGSLLTTVPPVKHIFYVTEFFSQYRLFLMKFSSTWFMETPFLPFLLPQICQIISSLPIPYTVHPFITSARVYPTLPLLSLDPRQVTPHFDYFGNISSSLSVSILPLTLACFQSSNPYDSFEIHIKSSCNQEGPYQAFPRKTSLPHILSYSSLVKYPDNSIWCRFHELLYICKKPPPNKINYLMIMST